MSNRRFLKPEFDVVLIYSQTLTSPPSIYLNHDMVEVRRQDGFSGPEFTHFSAIIPSGAVGGDDAGRQFIYVPGTGIVEYDPNVPETVLNILPEPAPFIEGLAFDGFNLFASDPAGNLFTLNPDDGTVVHAISTAGGGLFGLGAVGGDGGGGGFRLLAGTGSGGTNEFCLVELQTDPVAEILVGPARYNPGLDFDPISGVLYGASSSLRIIDPADGSYTTIGLIYSASESGILMRSIAFAPDGTLYGHATSSNKLYTIDKATAFATEVGVVSAITWGIDFAPDGTLYSAFGSLFILDPVTGDTLATIGSLGTYVVDIDYAPDGFIYGVYYDNSNLYQIDPSDASTTLIGTYESSTWGMASQHKGGGATQFVLPEVDEYEVTLTGKVGQPIDVILAGQDGVDFSTELLELLDTDGVTVLETGVPNPLGVPAENYDLAILDFIVPADGLYTLRFTSTVEGDYGIVVTDPLIFDSEPNYELTDPLRSLDGVNAAIGYLSGAESSEDSLTIPASDGNFPRGTALPSIGLAPVQQPSGNPAPADPAILADYSAYGWEALNNILAEFNVDAPEILNTAAPLSVTTYAGDFDNSGDFSTVYAINDATNTLISIDTTTGAVTSIGPTTPYGGENWTGMAADPTSGAMYACSTSVSASSLYTIDLTTGAATRIGTITNSPGIIAMAVDDTGQAYGHDIVNDSLIAIDKATGAGTIVGLLGFDANFAQGMDFDEVSGQLYLAAFNNSSYQAELRIADRTTGATTLVGVLGSTIPGGTTELCWMGVAAGGGGLDADDLYEITLAAGETLVVYTQTPFDDPATTPLNELDPGLVLYDSSGTPVEDDSNTEDGKNARLIYTATTGGTYTIEVFTEDGAGEYLLKTEVFTEPLPLLRIDNVAVEEGDGGQTVALFTVRLSEPSASPVTVQFDTCDGTEYTTSNGAATLADGDYGPVSGLVEFLPGETEKTVQILVNGDTDIEPNEDFFARLGSAAGAIIADPHGVCTILNDDTSISIEDVEPLEGDTGVTLFEFVVSLVAPLGVPLTVDYATANGTATEADLDYVPTSGTLIFDPGEIEKTISVEVLSDTQIEPDEWFYVDLSNPDPNEPVTKSRSVGTILNDDTEISIDDVTLAEGDYGKTAFNFTVGLAAPVHVPVTVQVNTADGTATVKDNDYLPISGLQLTFGPQEITKTVTVNVIGDTKVEPSETFRVNLNNASQPIAKSQGIGTIVNDDDEAPTAIGNVVMDGRQQRSCIAHLTVQFSEPVNVSDVTDMSLFNLTTSTAVDISAATLLGNGTAEVTWELCVTDMVDVAPANTSDGYYTATLSPAGVTDLDGNPLSAEYEFVFHKMAGDGTGDAKVNGADFSTVMGNWDPLPGPMGRDGDLNCDGRVNGADFSVIMGNWDPIGLPPLPLVMIVETDGSTEVAEESVSTDTYEVVPARPVKEKPTKDVTVELNNTNGQLTAVDDSIVEGTHTGEITHSTSSSDPDCGNISNIAGVTAAITDKDTASLPGEPMAAVASRSTTVLRSNGQSPLPLEEAAKASYDGSVLLGPLPMASVGFNRVGSHFAAVSAEHAGPAFYYNGVRKANLSVEEHYGRSLSRQVPETTDQTERGVQPSSPAVDRALR